MYVIGEGVPPLDKLFYVLVKYRNIHRIRRFWLNRFIDVWGGESLEDGVKIGGGLKSLTCVICQLLESDRENFVVGGLAATLKDMTVHV